MMMLVWMFKSHKPRASKYCLEYLRFVIQLFYVLLEQRATEAFCGMSVNTRGQINTFVPADKWMEWVVRTVKKHINHMMQNPNVQ